MVERLDRALTTVEGLERHEGHLLNWYDTQTLSPMLPRYVSTVDSGNLAGALVALAEGCRQLGASRADLALRLSDLAQSRSVPGGRDELRVPLRPPAPALLDRLSPGRRRWAGPRRQLLLRPPGFGGAPGELSRHRQGRRPAEPLVPPGPARRQRGRRPDARLVGRDDVRVPDAAPLDAVVSGDAPRPELPHGRPQADPVRSRPARAVGNLRVRLRSGRPARQLPVQGVRRPGTRVEARAGRRARRRSLRDRIGRSPRAGRSRAKSTTPDGRERRGAVRLLRRYRLHGAGAGRSRRHRGCATPPWRHREDPPGAPPGDDPGRHRQRPAGRRDGRPVPCGPSDPGDRAPSPGANPTPGAGHRAASGREDPDRTARARARPTPPPLPPYAVPAGTDPVQRQLRRDRHQRGRWDELLPRSCRDAVAGGRHPRSRKPVRLSARRPHRGRLVRDLPAYGQGARQLLRGIPRREGDLRAARPRRRDASRGRRFTRGRRRGPARLADQSERPPARDRADQLRRAGPGVHRRRRRQPRVREALRRNGVDRRELGSAGAAPAARPGRLTARRLSRPLHSWTDAGAGRVGNRPDALPRARAWPRRSPSHGRARPVGHDRRGPRPDPESAHPSTARARGIRPRLVHHRRCRRRAGGTRLRAAVPRPRRRRPRLRPGLHAGAGVPAASRHFHRTGPALRAARVPRLLLRRIAALRRGDPGEEHSRAGRSVATRHFGRSPDRPRPRDGAGGRAARSPDPGRPRALAPEGAEGGRRDPERTLGELPPRAERAARAARRRRPVERLEREARRRVSAPGRFALGSREGPVEHGRPGGPFRRGWHPGAAARPPGCGASAAAGRSARRRGRR